MTVAKLQNAPASTVYLGSNPLHAAPTRALAVILTLASRLTAFRFQRFAATDYVHAKFVGKLVKIRNE